MPHRQSESAGATSSSYTSSSSTASSMLASSYTSITNRSEQLRRNNPRACCGVPRQVRYYQPPTSTLPHQQPSTHHQSSILQNYESKSRPSTNHGGEFVLHTAQPRLASHHSAQSSSSSSTSSYTSSSSSTSSSSTQSTRRHDLMHQDEDEIDQLDTQTILSKHNRDCLAQPISAPPNASMLYEPKRNFTPYVSLGPVIGMVTETTARILAEVSADTDFKCFLTDSRGVQHGVQMRARKHTPVVFAFTELEPNTLYRVNFDIPVPGLVRSRFRTLSSDWASQCNVRIGCVSGHNFPFQRDHIAHENDLWRSLYSQHISHPFDYCLHLGNNVFVDNQKYVDSPDGRIPCEEGLSVFNTAVQFCDEIDPSILHQAEDHVCEMFRNAYRDTWLQPCARHCLANMPNLMICGPMDLGQVLDSRGHSDPYKEFVYRCAYRVYNEYCRGLFENIVADVGETIRIDQAFHFHAFGDIGLMFLDTTAHHIHHRCRSHEDHETAFLGARQWEAIEYSLSPHGYLAGCRVLLVCTTSPIAQCGEGGWFAKKQADLVGTWNTPQGLNEASLLLSKLFDWKNSRNDGRQVIILAGSLSDAGISIIKDNRYERGMDTIQQFTSGAISNDRTKQASALKSAGMNTGIGVYHSFKHTKKINNCAFMTLDIESSIEGALRVSAHHTQGYPNKKITPPKSLAPNVAKHVDYEDNTVRQ